MQQMTIEDAIAANSPRCIVPPKGTDCYKLLLEFQVGKRHTMKSGLLELGISAVSQRVSNLILIYGWPIRKAWKDTPKGATVREYFL